MKRFTFGIGLQYDRDNKPLAHIDLRKLKAFDAITSVYGAFFATSGIGGWTSPKHGLVIESGMSVTVFSDGTLDSARSLASRLAAIFNQETVLLAVETVNALEFCEQVQSTERAA